MVGISQVRASMKLSDGGKQRGGGGRRLDVCDFCFGEVTSDSDLRWVPSGSREVIFGKLCQGRFEIPLSVIAIGTVEGHGSLALILQFSPVFQCPLNSSLDAMYFTDSLSVVPKEWAAVDDKLCSGICDGIRDAQTQISGGSLHRKEAGQGSLVKMNLKARNTEVSSLSDSQKIYYRAYVWLRIRKSRVAELVGGYIYVSVVVCIGGLQPNVARFICQYCETGCNVSLFRTLFNPRGDTLELIWLVELIWNDIKPKREVREAHSANVVVADSIFVNSFNGLKVVSFGLMASSSVVSNLMEWLNVDQVRIIILSLFSGFVYVVHLERDMCLFSVKSYTALISAKHVHVQCVWKHCSFLGWSDDYTCYIRMTVYS